MIIERRAAERGQADHGWLRSAHTFSFAGYYDPQWMGFGPLRVINEDRVAGGGGFAPHSHANMEIVSVVLSGELAHRDSQGNAGVIRAGDVQWMSAGHGVEHSEMNGGATDPVHFLQIWVQPNQVNATPQYGQEHFAFASRLDQWVTLAAPEGRDGALPWRQDAVLFGRGLRKSDATTRQLDPTRRYWLQILGGELEVELGGTVRQLNAGDAIGLVDEDGELALRQLAEDEVQLLWFDLPR